MTNRAILGTLVPRTTSRRRFAGVSRAGWGMRRIRRAGLSMPLPTMEEVEERLRNYRGFIARLTPEQIAAMDATDEFEVLGSPNGPKRKF